MTEIIWNGPDGLRDRLVPVDQLVRHPRNPRRGRVALIAESLGEFGQVRPVLTDGSLIVAGNHTYLAAVELGWTHVAAVANTFESEEEARAYMLADNRLPELGSYASEQLLTLLEELEQVDGWAGTGYTADDLEDLRAMQDAIPTTAPATFAGTFAASDEELAARAAALGAGNSFKEWRLLLTADQDADFERHVRILTKAHGGGFTEAVFRAVASQAAQ